MRTPFSDAPPSGVFPATEWGRALQRSFVAEEPDVLLGTTVICDEYEAASSPLHTDDDLYRDKGIPVCGRRKRDGVRDRNWCCRCPSGFPHAWLTKRDAEGLRDSHSLTF